MTLPQTTVKQYLHIDFCLYLPVYYYFNQIIMKKKKSSLRLNKKQVSILNKAAVKGGFPVFTNRCPVETINITFCYGNNQCQKWPG